MRAVVGPAGPLTLPAPGRSHVRLRDGRAIAAALAGRRAAGTFAAVHTNPSDAAHARLAVVASRRVGGAVVRNRARRLLREAARAIAWRPGNDVVLVARRDCASSTLAPVADEVERLARRLGVVA